MINLQLKRIALKKDYTIGRLFIDGEYFCDTLEDPVRDIAKEGKIYANTAIPKGTYQIILNRSPRFNRILPRLLAVPYFEGILIHRGNTAADTAGCILVGENKVKGKVINSTKWEIELCTRLSKDTDIRIIVE